jgi:hypothetical protein
MSLIYICDVYRKIYSFKHQSLNILQATEYWLKPLATVHHHEQIHVRLAYLFFRITNLTLECNTK